MDDQLLRSFENSGLRYYPQNALTLTDIIKGKGSFGTVRVAYVEKNGVMKAVAAKHIDEKFLDNIRFMRRFQRSLGLFSNPLLRSDNLCLPFGYTAGDGIITGDGIIMLSELFDSNLSEYTNMVKTANITIETAGRRLLDSVIDISKGLKALGAAGILHRDIKPHNALVMHENGTHLRTAITDMDLAGFDTAHGGPKTATLDDIDAGVMIGTPWYWHPLVHSNPELLNSANPVILDYYPLGVVMAEIFFDHKAPACGYEPLATTFIDIRRNFRNNLDLENMARRWNLQGLERIMIRLTDPQYNRAYQNIDEIIEDLTAIKEGNSRKVTGKKDNAVAWRFRIGDEAFYEMLSKKRKTRHAVSLAVASAMMVCGAAYEIIRYRASPIPLLSAIEHTQNLPDTQTAKNLSARIARDCKERMISEEIENVSHNATLKFPGGSVHGRKGLITYEKDSFWSGEYMIDLAQLYLSSGDIFFKDQYMLFAKELTLDTGGKTELEGPVLGRFQGLAGVRRFASSEDKELIERPVLAGRLLMQTWYDKDTRTLCTPALRPNCKIDIRHLYSSLNLLSLLPFHYSYDEFLGKRIDQFSEWDCLSADVKRLVKITDTGTVNVLDLAEILLAIPESNITHLWNGNLLKSSVIISQDGEIVESKNSDISWEHAAAIDGIVRSLEAIAYITDERSSYGAAMQRQLGAKFSEKTSLIRMRANRLSKTAFEMMRAYHLTYTEENLPRTSPEDSDSDIGGAIYMARAARALLSIEGFSEADRQKIYSMHNRSLRGILSTKHYYPRPWPRFIGSEPFEFGIIGESSIQKDYKGALSGHTGRLLELLNSIN